MPIGLVHQCRHFLTTALSMSSKKKVLCKNGRSLERGGWRSAVWIGGNRTAEVPPCGVVHHGLGSAVNIAKCWYGLCTHQNQLRFCRTNPPHVVGIFGFSWLPRIKCFFWADQRPNRGDGPGEAQHAAAGHRFDALLWGHDGGLQQMLVCSQPSLSHFETSGWTVPDVFSCFLWEPSLHNSELTDQLPLAGILYFPPLRWFFFLFFASHVYFEELGCKNNLLYNQLVLYGPFGKQLIFWLLHGLSTTTGPHIEDL